MSVIDTPQTKFSRFLFTDTRMAWFWLLLRLYAGWEWVTAGWDKIHNPLWVGAQAGTAISGFLNGALAKTSGVHPDVFGWYAWFIEHFAIPHATSFSYLVSFGELAVGLGLIFGLFTALAAFFGAVMNFNYLFAGTVSINPLFGLIEILLLLAWRTAGYYGLDNFRKPFKIWR